MKIIKVLLISLLFICPLAVKAVELDATKNEGETTEEKSQKYNNNLKELEVEGYTLNFDKYKKIYTIEVPEEVNSLNVKAATEDKGATFTIKGADNLEENNNKVVVEVTAADGDKKTYVVNVEKKAPVEVATKASFKIDDNIIQIAIYGAAGILAAGLLIFGIVKIRDRKIEKEIDKL